MTTEVPVFAQPQVYFHIVHSCFTDDEVQRVCSTSSLAFGHVSRLIWLLKLSQDLEQRGAQSVSLASHAGDNRASLEKVTHIVTRTIDFPEYSLLSDPSPNRNVVRPEWIAASIAKGKQVNPRHHSADPKMFFSGLIMTCADLPDSDKDAIIGYINTVGGMYSGSVTRQVTHIVALTTESDKCKAAIEKGLRCKMVLPHW